MNFIIYTLHNTLYNNLTNSQIFPGVSSCPLTVSKHTGFSCKHSRSSKGTRQEAQANIVMNARQSQRCAAGEDAAAPLGRASLVIENTCAVRLKQSASKRLVGSSEDQMSLAVDHGAFISLVAHRA